jgi:hypothetical protein
MNATSRPRPIRVAASVAVVLHVRFCEAIDPLAAYDC